MVNTDYDCDDDDEKHGVTMIKNDDVIAFLSFRKGKMEGLKVLIAVIFITTSSSLSVSAPVGGAASTAQVLFKHAIAQGVKNAIREV